jgi:hypothetical protein
MSRQQKCLVWLVVAAAVLAGCERIEDRGAARPSLDFRETIDAVPGDYGRFVGISAAGRHAANVALWFEGPDQTLRAVRVNTSNGAISRDVIVVPRQ